MGIVIMNIIMIIINSLIKMAVDEHKLVFQRPPLANRSCPEPMRSSIESHVSRPSSAKGMFYAVQYPVRWNAQSALHFTTWQTCSFRHLSTAVYSQVLIYTAEWGIMDRMEMSKLRNGSKGDSNDSNPGSLD